MPKNAYFFEKIRQVPIRPPLASAVETLPPDPCALLSIAVTIKLYKSAQNL